MLWRTREAVQGSCFGQLSTGPVFPRTCADLVRLMHTHRAAFQNETSGQTLCQTWARLESKSPSLLFHLSSLNVFCKTGLCWTGKLPACRWQCHHPQPVSPPPPRWTPAWALLKKTWQAVPTECGILSVSTFSDFSVLPTVACCPVLGQSLLHHLTPVRHGLLLSCFFFLVFLVCPLHPVHLVSTYTLKSKPTMADIEVSLPFTPA